MYGHWKYLNLVQPEIDGELRICHYMEMLHIKRSLHHCIRKIYWYCTILMYVTLLCNANQKHKNMKSKKHPYQRWRLPSDTVNRHWCFSSVFDGFKCMMDQPNGGCCTLPNFPQSPSLLSACLWRKCIYRNKSEATFSWEISQNLKIPYHFNWRIIFASRVAKCWIFKTEMAQLWPNPWWCLP